MTSVQTEPETRSTHLNWNPSRVIYAMAGVIVVWLSLGEYEMSALNASRRTGDLSAFSGASRHYLLTTPFVYIAALTIAVCFFRPVSNLFTWSKEIGDLGWRTLGKNVLLGLLAGSLVSLLTSPLPITPGPVQLEFVATFFSGSNAAYFLFPIWIFLAAAIATCMELLFRGILFRSLAEYASVPASVITSCLIGAYLWPAENPYAGVVFGAVSAILFYKSRLLLASIIAATVFLVAAPFCSAAVHHVIR